MKQRCITRHNISFFCLFVTLLCSTIAIEPLHAENRTSLVLGPGVYWLPTSVLPVLPAPGWEATLEKSFGLPAGLELNLGLLYRLNYSSAPLTGVIASHSREAGVSAGLRATGLPLSPGWAASARWEITETQAILFIPAVALDAEFPLFSTPEGTAFSLRIPVTLQFLVDNVRLSVGVAGTFSLTGGRK